MRDSAHTVPVERGTWSREMTSIPGSLIAEGSGRACGTAEWPWDAQSARLSALPGLRASGTIPWLQTAVCNHPGALNDWEDSQRNLVAWMAIGIGRRFASWQLVRAVRWEAWNRGSK